MEEDQWDGLLGVEDNEADGDNWEYGPGGFMRLSTSRVRSPSPEELLRKPTNKAAGGTFSQYAYQTSPKKTTKFQTPFKHAQDHSRSAPQHPPSTPKHRRVPPAPPPLTPQTRSYVAEAQSDIEPDAPYEEPPAGCVSILEINDAFRHIFPYSFFNQVQSACFQEVFYSDINMVVSAPTGSGKTTIMELAIVRLIQQIESVAQGRLRGAKKVVYMAPIKALCQQIYHQWSEKFGKVGLKCFELTGDSEDVSPGLLNDVDIVITTPEKWDSMTRKWKENKALMNQISLFLIDEVHLLNEDRGATLEAVVSRMNTMRVFDSEESGTSLRFIALSATIPNIEDIAEWLQVPTDGIKKFGGEYRPIKLDVKVFGYAKSKNDFLFDRKLDYKLFELIRMNSKEKPTLIAATHVAKDGANYFVKEREHRQRLITASQKTTDKTLAELIKVGIGYHTAGMNFADRGLVERLFLNGDLLVVCATTSLSQGVNFPGRAGRPQFDDSGVAIIMTQADDRDKWSNLLNGKHMIESNLLVHLTEHLNSEVVLRTITDATIAVTWLKSTYLYKRVQRNPAHYNIQRGLSEVQLTAKLKEILMKALNDLAECGLIERSHDGTSIRPLELGILMAKYYIEFETMKMIVAIPPDASVANLIGVISSAKEFSNINLRVAEKKVLNEFNTDKNNMRFPQEGKIKTNSMKVNCLIQATLGNMTIEDWGLKQEAQNIFSSANRLCKGIVQCLAVKKQFIALRNSIILCKCLSQRMWEDSPFVLKGGIDSFEKLAAADPRRIEILVGRHPPFGNEVRDNLSKLPKLELEVQQTVRVIKNSIEISVTCRSLSIPKVSSYNSTYLVAGDTDNKLLFYKKYRTASITELNEKFIVENPNPRSRIAISLMNEEYIGLDVSEYYSPRGTQLVKQDPSKFINNNNNNNINNNQIINIDGEDQNSATLVPANYGAISSAGNKIDYFSAFDDDDDDLSWMFSPDADALYSAANLSIVPVTNPNPKIVPAPAVNKPPAKAKNTQAQPNSDETACKHTCKDRSACKHECCKGGLKTPRRKRPASEPTPKDTPKKVPQLHLLRTKTIHNVIMTPTKRLKKTHQTPLTDYFQSHGDEQVVPDSPPPQPTFQDEEGDEPQFSIGMDYNAPSSTPFYAPSSRPNAQSHTTSVYTPFCSEKFDAPPPSATTTSTSGKPVFSFHAPDMKNIPPRPFTSNTNNANVNKPSNSSSYNKPATPNFGTPYKSVAPINSIKPPNLQKPITPSNPVKPLNSQKPVTPSNSIKPLNPKPVISNQSKPPFNTVSPNISKPVMNNNHNNYSATTTTNYTGNAENRYEDFGEEDGDMFKPILTNNYNYNYTQNQRQDQDQEFSVADFFGFPTSDENDDGLTRSDDVSAVTDMEIGGGGPVLDPVVEDPFWGSLRAFGL